ncbi:hypothetical protein LZ31DRAFT_551648 [Colletotrichum somersetense]|nr:hypothetical protein LZ31DRAFT_551648 [Colletotrichum somersetense]
MSLCFFGGGGGAFLLLLPLSLSSFLELCVGSLDALLMSQTVAAARGPVLLVSTSFPLGAILGRCRFRCWLVRCLSQWSTALRAR